ncbi:MAG: TraR/DksA C4-type zinc finger protein [Balneolaceae bacterium]
MNESEKQRILEIIRQQLRDIAEEIGELKELTKPVEPDKSIGRLSRMDAINNKTINDSALREKKKLKQRLEKALERSGNKGFGDCMMCGKPIALGRLEYLPHTTRCIVCAGK